MIRPPDEQYLHQGDVIVDVPLSVAPPRVVWVDKEGDGADTRFRLVLEPRVIGYSIGQTQLMDAMILTYDCDLDRVLERIVAGGERVADDVCTVVATLEVNPENSKLGSIIAGEMPRYSYLPETVTSPARIIDFSTVQNVDMRLLLRSMKALRRLFSLSENGQKRLLEVFAHALGDVWRRGRPGGPNDPELLAKALAIV